jgi:hypothetical protein
MNTTARRTTAVVGTIVAATALVAAPPAQSATLARSRVTVSASDSTPASGQTFRLSGAVWSNGSKVPATIRVKTLRNGQWVQLPGAVMQTNRSNQYRIRIVLQKKGKRQLRVVGDPKPARIATSRKTITVTVH